MEASLLRVDGTEAAEISFGDKSKQQGYSPASRQHYYKGFDKNGRLEVYIVGTCPRQGLPYATAGIGVWIGDGNRHPFNLSRPLSTGDQSRDRAKLIAAYEGLLLAKEKCKVVKVRLFTHSKMIYYGMRSNMYEWEENGWNTDDQRPVENCDIWKNLLKIARHFNECVVQYVPRNSLYGMRMAEKLAWQAAESRSVSF